MQPQSDRYQYPLSAAVAKFIRAEPYRCWRNAALAVVLLPDLFAFGRYVEGWVVVPREHAILVFEHGWCLTPGRLIVDPTSVLTEKRDQPVVFFQGSELSRPALCGLISGGLLPLVCHTCYGEDGMGHPGYKQGFLQAQQFARELAEARGLPPSAVTILKRSPVRGVTVIVDPPQQETR